jgi:hypothetical protein
VKGRNTSVISLRLDDDVIKYLKTKARNRNLTLSDYLKNEIKELHKAEIKYEAIRIENEKLGSPGFKEVTKEIEIKIGDNQPCPCGAKYPDGNRKKYKHCCGSKRKSAMVQYT